MTKFNHCPNCLKLPDHGFFDPGWMFIHECKACSTLYCRKCGGKRCPNCGCRERTEAGKCYAK